jgi:hypothetical protein
MKNYMIAALLLPMALLGWALAQTPPATQPSKPATRPTSTDKVFDTMLKPVDTQQSLVLQPAQERSHIDASSGAASVAPHAPSVNLIRENSPLPDKTGRLTKTADGKEWQFAFDADGKTLQDPPMILLPNLNLESMEDAVNNGDRNMRFHVTGVVYEYHGRNYLLVQTVTIPAAMTQQF